MNRKERRAAQSLGRGTTPGRTGPGPLLTAQTAMMFAQAVRHRQNGEIAEADAICRTILASRPDHAPSLHLRGSIALHAGQPQVAIDLIRKAIAAQDRVAEYHDELGLALRAIGRPQEAIASLRRALALEPENGRSHNNLGVILLEQGQLAEARVHFAKALAAAPELLDTYGNVLGLLFTLNPPLQAAAERAEHGWPGRLSIAECFGPAGLSVIAGDPYFHAVLTYAPVRAVALERLLTGVRCELLKSAVATRGAFSEEELNFCCTLAKQCFINEYVFAATAEEIAAVERIRQSLSAANEAKSDVPPLWLAILACYAPLGSLADAAGLLARSWPGAIEELLTQQLREPAEERRLRETTPRLTPIEDTTSLLVQRQYEENPYPRWVVRPARQVPAPIDHYLRWRIPGAQLAGRSGSDATDILIAGCGTGQHPIGMAERFVGARVLAVDLSLASLAYAQRKTRELGVKNIEYAQADVLKLGSIGRTFDLVDASGVLHHLADPIAGWRVLRALVRPNGFMRIGLYSEAARRDVVAAREFCAQRGYRPTAEEIRAARQELLAHAELKSVTRFGDFFSTSECRDLLFHVQEHRFTIAQIGAALAQLELRFVGFELPFPVYAAYRQRFPDDAAMKKLDNWDRFETEQPQMFTTMYQFWAQAG